MASAFVLAARAAGLSCRLRNDTAFSGPGDVERADVAIVLPDRPRTGLIASEYFKRQITVVTASISDTADSLLSRVTAPKEVDNGQQGSAEPIQSGHHEADASSDVADQGSQPDSGLREEGPPSLIGNLVLDEQPTSALSVEEKTNDTRTRRNTKGRKQ